MASQYNSNLKTLGPRSAQLYTELQERRRSTFTLEDVSAITGLSGAAARGLVHKAQSRGLVTRLKPGLYNLVPFELGRATEYVGSPYLIARELAGDAVYFLSHGTALEIHRMTTQPTLAVYVSCTRRLRAQTVGGYDYKFIHINPEHSFGQMRHWIDKEQFVQVSDMERTVIDGLRQPAYVGGVTEVAKGVWMQHQALQIDRLVGYAVRLGVGAVVRRLGFLLEHYELADAAALAPLRAALTSTYQRLDPLLPDEGAFLSRWKLRLNVTPEELDAVRLG